MANAHVHSAHTTDTAHSMEHVKKHRKVYVMVFLALLVGTVLTVSMYYVHFNSMTITITIALFIATVKALLVAGFFMHLISEKRAIYSTLAVTIFFFAAMMYLILWSRSQVPRGTEYIPTKYYPHPMVAPAK
jgi:cytochrome c oxidase subunit IV